MPTAVIESPRLVVTGFGPFGDHDYNPSWDVAQAMADSVGTDAHRLPVTFVTAAQFAGAHLRIPSDSPLLFVHLGLGSQRSKICFERCATNRRDDTPDQRERRNDCPPSSARQLLDENRDQRFSRLDVSTLVDEFNGLDADSLPDARVSEDCGSFVCNALLYHSLRACQQARAQGQPADALFIHVPMLEADDAKDLGELLAGVFTPVPNLR